MDTQETPTNNHELPSPTGNTVAGASESTLEVSQPHEQSTAPSSVPDQPAATSPVDPTAAQPAGAAPSGQPAVSGVTAHLSAEDADLIEKEWVLKAKEIVARTHGDPFVQNNEINKIKADYIKKRYNKDIKQTNEWPVYFAHFGRKLAIRCSPCL